MDNPWKTTAAHVTSRPVPAVVRADAAPQTAMTYELYGYAPEPESVECFQDFEEAAARCEELVHEDGYDSGEVWADSGDLVYRVGRRPASLGSTEPGVIELPRTSRRRTDAPRAIPVVRDDDRVRRTAGASAGTRAESRAQPLAASPPAPEDPAALWVLGDSTTAPAIWFGDTE